MEKDPRTRHEEIYDNLNEVGGRSDLVRAIEDEVAEEAKAREHEMDEIETSEDRGKQEIYLIETSEEEELKVHLIESSEDDRKRQKLGIQSNKM